MALIVKGYNVSFDMIDGRQIDAPASYGMIHDPTGRQWKSTSLLVAPYEKGEEAEGDRHTRDYFGASHLTRMGDIRLPPKSLADWRSEGDVDWIWYHRQGRKHITPTRSKKHKFNKTSLASLLKGKGRARLYSRNGCYRLELPRNAIVDDRGLVWP